jgi:hypothetical protein
MKYVSGPYFEPDFDPLLDRFGTPGYACPFAPSFLLLHDRSLARKIATAAPDDEHAGVVAGSWSTMTRARTARS